MRTPQLFLFGLLVPAVAQGVPPSPAPTAAASLTDSLRADVDSLAHQVGSTDVGAGVYSFPVHSPPARLPPGLSLTYSSRATAPDREAPRGWRIGGVPEIQRDRRTPGRFQLSGPVSGVLQIKLAAHPNAWSAVHLTTQRAGAVEVHYHPGDDRWRVRTADGAVVLLGPADAPGPAGPTARWRASRRFDAQGNELEYLYDEQGRLLRVVAGGVDNDDVAQSGILCTDFHYREREHLRTSGAFGGLEEFDRVLRWVRVGRLGPRLQAVPDPPPHDSTGDHLGPGPICIDVVGADGEHRVRCSQPELGEKAPQKRDGERGDAARREGQGAPRALSDLEWTLRPGGAPDGLPACWPFRDYVIESAQDGGAVLLRSILELGYADPSAPPTELEPRVSFTYDVDGVGLRGAISEVSLEDLGHGRSFAFGRDDGANEANNPIAEEFAPDYTFAWGGETTAALLDLNGDARADYVESEGEGWTVRFQKRDGEGVAFNPPVSVGGPALPIEQRRPVFYGRTGTGLVGAWGESVCLQAGLYSGEAIGEADETWWRWCMQHSLDARIVTTQDVKGVSLSPCKPQFSGRAPPWLLSSV